MNKFLLILFLFIACSPAFKYRNNLSVIVEDHKIINKWKERGSEIIYIDTLKHGYQVYFK